MRCLARFIDEYAIDEYHEDNKTNVAQPWSNKNTKPLKLFIYNCC